MNKIPGEIKDALFAILYRLLRMPSKIEMDRFLGYDSGLLVSIFDTEICGDRDRQPFIRALNRAIDNKGVDYNSEYLDFGFSKEEIYIYLCCFFEALNPNELPD